MNNNDEITRLREQVRSLTEDNRILKLQNDGEHALAASWLQMKVERQRRALDILNRKVLSQRFRLRVLNEMGRDLTKDEYLAARDALENEQVKERIEEYAPVA